MSTASSAIAVPSSRTPRRVGVRSVAALLVFLIAALITPVALVGHWGNRTVTDTTRFVDTVAPLAQNPAMQDAVSAELTKVITEQVNTSQLVNQVLGGVISNPTLEQTISGPITAGINSLIGQAVHSFVSSDAFNTIWLAVLTGAQKSLMAVLEGRPGGPVSLQGDQLVLNITSLLQAVQQHLVTHGLSLASHVTIPPNAGQVVLFNSPALAQLRLIYSFTNPLLAWFPLILTALFVLAVWLARRRARMVMATGIALLVGTVALDAALNIGQGVFVDQLSNTFLAPVSNIFWNTFFAYLVQGVQAMIVLSVAVIIAGWLGSRFMLATKVRAALSRGLRQIGGGLRANPLSALVARKPGAWHVGISAITLLLIATGDVMHVWHVLWCIALGAGLWTGAEILQGAPSGNTTGAPALTAA